MKRLSDYKDEEALALWADLFEPIAKILGDPDFAKMVTTGKSRIEMVSLILSKHTDEAKRIMLRVDPTPIDGLSVFARLMSLLVEIGRSEEIKSFFGYAEQVSEDENASGLPTENTEVVEKK